MRSPSLSTQSKVLSFRRKGEEQLHAGQPEVAIQFFTAAINLDLQRAELFVLRGMAKLWLGEDEEEALTDFLTASKKNARSIAAHYYIGLVYLQRHDFEMALAAFEKMMELKPKELNAQDHFYFHAVLNHVKSEHRASNKPCTCVIQLNVDHPRVQALQKRFNSAEPPVVEYRESVPGKSAFIREVAPSLTGPVGQALARYRQIVENLDREQEDADTPTILPTPLASLEAYKKANVDDCSVRLMPSPRRRSSLSERYTLETGESSDHVIDRPQI